jgi:diguanylate cyclase (GGDEF)-like protein/PAS domain S-box-containing protein
MVASENRGEAVPRAVRDALARLADGDWLAELGSALAAVGSSVGVDRVYVFQNMRGPDGRLWMDLCGEWDAPGIRGIFDDPKNHLHPYHPGFTSWIETLGSGGHIRAPSVADLPEPVRRVLSSEGTRSILVLPVTVAGEWWGYVGFDSCSGRDWSEDDLAAVRALAYSVTGAVTRVRAEEDRRLQADLFQTVVEQGPAVSYIDGVDDEASSVFMSPQIASIVGYTAEEFMADEELWPRLLHPDDKARALAENQRHNETGEPFRLEYRMFAKDGRVVWVHDEAIMVRDERGMPRYSVGIMVDISDRKDAEEQVAFQAYHDELTGLPSRAMFEELLDLSVARAKRHEGAVAVLCVDLDDFKLVNDSLGHRTGDGVLQLVADRLREATRETDLVARRGGDQFLLLLADLDREEGEIDAALVRAQSVAQRILASLAQPFVLHGTELYVSASIGISLLPHDASDAGTLQRNAEAAMYEAKKGGSAGFVVASDGGVDSAAKLEFVTRLRKAVELQRWTLHYQPVLELGTGKMIGVEALIRWIEPDGTMVPPLEFIPLAEELGLIERIGDWVVREIAYQMQAWRELGIDLEIGFNLSPRQFWQPDLAQRIVGEITAAGSDPSRIMVEVTESSAMMDPDRAQQVLMELKDAGFSLAIDDFGTGYSSLSRLREMPVNVLKIDRSFVSRVHEDRQSAAIVGAFLELAGGLDMVTLAEGIETEDELAFLRERGCSLGQGFHFSKPVPPEEIIVYALGGIPAAAGLRSA